MSKFILLKKTWVDFSLDASPTKLVVLLALVFLTTVSVTNAQNCTSSADCSRADGEQCRHGTCIQTIASSRNVSECHTNGDCLTSQVCCNHRCLQNWNCLGENCSLDTDCQLVEICCYGICREDGECTGIIAAVIICSVAFILMVAICFSACRYVILDRKRFRFQGNSDMSWSASTAIFTSNEIADQSCNTGDYPAKTKSCRKPKKDEQMPLNTMNMERENKVNGCVPSYGSTLESNTHGAGNHSTD